MKIPLIEREKERRQTAKALQESEARYQELADSITDIFFALDKELKFTYWNKAAENLTGIPINEALGKSVYEIFRELNGTQMEKVSLKVLETQQPQNFVQLYPLKGKPAFFEISVYPSREGFSVFAKDITYRKHMEDALKKSWDYLENLNNSLGDAIFTVTLPDQAIEYVNRAVEHIFGYTIEECIGENTRVFFPEKKRIPGVCPKTQRSY